MAPTSIDFQVFPLTIRKIAIDPGHGGEDGGAVTALGLLEKDITLDIARRLRRLLEQSAFEVLMTRQRDETVSLAQRAVQANAGGADLFISIHVNSFKTPEVRGPETYYLGPTDDPHTLQLAALENRPSGYSLGEYRQLLESVYLDVRRTQSQSARHDDAAGAASYPACRCRDAAVSRRQNGAVSRPGDHPDASDSDRSRLPVKR